MNLNLLLQRSYRLILAILLFTIVAVPQAYSQSYNNPLLSLVGADGDWNEDWYPDGRLTLSPSLEGQPTEILLPIFIRYYSAGEKIYSMSFSVKYDSRMFEPISVQTYNPKLNDPKFPDAAYTIARDFNFTMKTHRDTTFLHYLDITNPTDDNNKNGASVKIVGISSHPLPNTSDDAINSTYQVLCYLRLKVKPVLGVDNSLLGRSTYIMFNQDSIYYNDVRITGNPDLYPGLAGLRMEKTNPLWNTEPIKPGVIIANIGDKMPAFDFTMQSIIGEPLTKNANGSLYELIDPITVDSMDIQNLYDENYGHRYIEIFNSEAGTRLNQIQITSDQPWLEVETSTDQGGQNLFDFDQPSYIPFLDNGILGQIYNPIDRADIIPAKGEVWLHVRCNPKYLIPRDGEMCGTYVGYLTFTSQTAKVNPVRLKVTFIYLRPPYEPELYNVDDNGDQEISHTGIRINIKQTSSDITKTLVFGVAPRATDGPDQLFGEAAYDAPMSTSFDARWYPVTAESQALAPYGFRDVSPDYDRPYYNSRDIRGLSDNFESIKYNCRFTTNSYPLYITWNVKDFPEGAILFLKDAQSSGQLVSVNMREASATGQANELSYTFENATLSEFNIEYTLPKVIKFVNQYGQPIIEKGWNLLSLPVKPTDARPTVVYPDGLSQPYYFYTDGWQASNDPIVPGKAFFMKFTEVLNNNYSGSVINEIGKNYGNYVRVTSGWNAVGSLSYPTSTEGISFEEYVSTADMPDLNFTRAYSVWGYRPNRGFHEVNELTPGLGYFIKVGSYTQSSASVEGYYKLVRTYNKSFLDNSNNAKQNVYNASTMINVRDNAQNESVVYISNNKEVNAEQYEMPPVIGNVFDVRFTNNGNLDNSDNSIIKLNGIDYPVSISMANADADYFFYDAISGELLGSISRNSNQNVEIAGTNANAVKVVKGNFEVNVYPNPVTTTSTVNYTVPAEGNVTIKLYDAIGNEVSTIVNANQKAGSASAELNVSNLTTGTYLVKINANGYNAVRTITVVK